MPNHYTISWSIVLEAENVGDALSQAWALLDDATKNNSGATILFVDGPDAEHLDFDMEFTGFCDECYIPYTTYSKTDHCSECGMCWDHCVNLFAHYDNGQKNA